MYHMNAADLPGNEVSRTFGAAGMAHARCLSSWCAHRASADARGPGRCSTASATTDEPLVVEAAGALRVVSAGRTGPRRRARHRYDPGVPARVQGAQAGHLDRPVPHAVPLAGHEPLRMTVAVRVAPGGRAVARRRARHRADPGDTARVQGAQAGHLDRPAPHAVPLAGHETAHWLLALVPVMP